MYNRISRLDSNPCNKIRSGCVNPKTELIPAHALLPLLSSGAEGNALEGSMNSTFSSAKIGAFWLMWFCFCLFFVSTLCAQSGLSSIAGEVTDPQGRAILGATVTLRSLERSYVRTQNTNDRGIYVFGALIPGIYGIDVAARGFKRLAVDQIHACVDQSTLLSHPLEIGEITISVTVTAEEAEARLNTQDATIGNNFSSSQISQFPLESRNVVTLLSIQPGVTPDGYVSGARADQANLTLDGVDVNEQQSGMDVIRDLAFHTDEAFASVLRVTPDSLQEFRVTISNPNASQGRSSGGQVSMITKSGTNKFHGSLYEFHRNTATSANNFFNNRTIDPNTGKSIPRPKMIRNLFGGSIGGPIKKDRAFLFFNYEGRRDASQQSVIRFVPLESLGRGEVRFPEVSGGIATLAANDLNQIFPVGINPAALTVLAEAARRYPANDFTLGDSSPEMQLNVGGYRFNAPTPLSWNSYIAKLDFNLTRDGRHTLFFRGNIQDDHIGNVPQFPDTPAPTLWSHPSGFALGYTWAINSNKVNSFRYGLTREAFSNKGDSAQNQISFRFVYVPRRDPPLRTLDRTTAVHNIVDDFSWIRGNHNLQMGGNARLIRNNRLSFSNSYDTAVTNPSFYEASGSVLDQPILDAGYFIAPGYSSPVQSAVAAVIGRYSMYTSTFNFDRSGKLQPTGVGASRTLATQEYDWYIQDVWKARFNLTFTVGLRYGVSRPVYEGNGYEAKPTVSLGDFFERRKAAAAAGMPLNDLIQLNLAGPANGRSGYYNWDKNNFQPRFSAAWSPRFDSGLLRKFFGQEGTSVIRAGFAITNDHIGQQLAVTFDDNNTLGFSTSQTIPANTYNVSDRPAPLFTGFTQDIRSLPGITTPGNLRFPVEQPADGSQRIEFSLDDAIRTPINYSWNISFGRQLPANLFIEASYMGRAARKLLAQRDIMQLNDLVDRKSGMDWYRAIGMLTDLRAVNTSIDNIRPIAYFENLFPGLPSQPYYNPALSPTQNVYSLMAREAVGGFNITDYTYIQAILDNSSVLGEHIFFHPQYGALATWSTVGESDYHAGTLSVHQQYTKRFAWRFNYTFSKSMDNASGLQKNGPYGNEFFGGFILNSLRPQDSRSYSDFDIRHIINGHVFWILPAGRDNRLLGRLYGFPEAVLGGWQLTGIYRWNSGLPAPSIFDANRWATNWNVQSYAVRTRSIESSPTRSGIGGPNLFSDPVYAYQSFRNPRAGETGDRNPLRLPGYVSLDIGLGKTFAMPWSENHTLQFRCEIFNITNTQRFKVSSDGYNRESFGIGQDPQLGTPPPTFGNLDSIQGSPRVMQFALRYAW
jgi:hypothetical protein